MAWTQRISDTFTDVNGTDLTAHTPDQGGAWLAAAGAIKVSSNTTNVTTTPALYRNATALANKQYAQFTVITRSALPAGGVCLGFSAGNATGYYVVANANVSVILRRYTGTGTATTDVLTVGTPASANDVLRVEFDGVNTLTVYRNGTSIGTYTDPSPYVGGSAGIPGLLVTSTVEDNFSAGDDAGGGATPAPLLPLLGVG